VASQGADGTTPGAAGMVYVSVSPLAGGSANSLPVTSLIFLVPSWLFLDGTPDEYGDEITKFNVGTPNTGTLFEEILAYQTTESTRATSQILCRDPFGFYWWAVNDGFFPINTKTEAGGSFDVGIHRVDDSTIGDALATIDAASGGNDSLPSALFAVPLRRSSGCYILKAQWQSGTAGAETGSARLHKLEVEDGLTTYSAVNMTWGLSNGNYNLPCGLAWTDGNGEGSDANLVFLAVRRDGDDGKWYVVMISPNTGQTINGYPRILTPSNGSIPCSYEVAFSAGPVLVPGLSAANAYHYALLNCAGDAKLVRWQSDSGGINDPSIVETYDAVFATSTVAFAITEALNALVFIYNSEGNRLYFSEWDADTETYTTTEVDIWTFESAEDGFWSFPPGASSAGPASAGYASPFVFVDTDGTTKFACPGQWFADGGSALAALLIVNATTGAIEKVVVREATGPTQDESFCSPTQYHGMRCDSAGYETYLALKAGGVT